MIQFRNFFKSIFEPVNQLGKNIAYQTVKMLNSFTPFYSNLSGNIYDEGKIRSCIHAIANHTAKLTPKIKFANMPSKRLANLQFLLENQPNEYMSRFDFIYKTISMLQTSCNAFIYCRYNVNGILTGLYPVNYSQIEFLESRDLPGELFVRFRFKNNSLVVTIPYVELIHLKRHYNDNDIFGSTQDEVLRPALSVLGVIRDGMINAVKSSGQLRGYLEITGNLKDESIAKAKQKFVESYMDVSGDGIGALDSRSKFVQLKVDPVQINATQRKMTSDDVRENFGVSEAIINGNYNEEAYNSFYNSVVEPLAMQMSNEFTNKLFTKNEIMAGNKIIFAADKMTFANNQTRAEIVTKLRALGLITANQGLDIMDMPRIEEDWADKYVISLNYVDASKANLYQGVETPKTQEGTAK